MLNPTGQQFFTVAEFAEITGDSESTIRRAIRDGSLPYVQRGPRKKIKIPRKALYSLQPSTHEEEDSSKSKPQIKTSKEQPISGPKSKLWRNKCQKRDSPSW